MNGYRIASIFAFLFSTISAIEVGDEGASDQFMWYALGLLAVGELAEIRKRLRERGR